jgi:predicted amidophosphoribosyltransferase
MKGLSGFLPQDDPNVKLMTAQAQIKDLKDQEDAIFAEIGRTAYAQNPGAFAAQASKLALIQANLTQAEASLAEANQAQEVAQAAQAALTCPNCATVNAEGVRFCHDCGSEIGAPKPGCPACGETYALGTRFCGGCGAKLIQD